MPHTQKFETRQYMLDNAFEAYYYVSANPSRVGSHFHNYYEVYLFESGDVTYAVGQQRYVLQPGDILLLPPKAPHYPVFGAKKTTYSRYVLWISERFIQNARDSCNCNFARAFDSVSESGAHLMRLPPTQRNGLFALALEMATRPGDLYARAENNISLLSFLITLNRLHADYDLNLDSRDAFAGHLVQALDFIINHYEADIGLQAVAEHCYLSKYHLAREFKRLMGMTVQQYVTLRRLTRARQWLQSGHKPGAAAKRCGFQNYSSFYRAYVAKYGQAPKAAYEQGSGGG